MWAIYIPNPFQSATVTATARDYESETPHQKKSCQDKMGCQPLNKRIPTW